MLQGLRYPALHAAHQRQGRALPADPATRMGLRTPIRLKPSPSGLTATLAAPLQRAAHPQRPRQPPSPSPAFGRSPGSTSRTPSSGSMFAENLPRTVAETVGVVASRRAPL